MVVIAIDEGRNFELLFECLVPGSFGDGITILWPFPVSRDKPVCIVDIKRTTLLSFHAN